jgi:hypothetical protein
MTDGEWSLLGVGGASCSGLSGLWIQIAVGVSGDGGFRVGGGPHMACNNQPSKFEVGLDVEPVQAKEFHPHNHHVYILVYIILLYLVF